MDNRYFDYVLLLDDIIYKTGRIAAANEDEADKIIRCMGGPWTRYVVEEVKR